MEKISVIMLTRNSQKHLVRCMDAIIMQKYPKFEIIVVDSHSTDYTLYTLNLYNNSKAIIRVITSDKDISVGKARQIGIDNATGEIIAFIDSDVELPHEHWLENMCKPLVVGYKQNMIENLTIGGKFIPKVSIAGVQTLAKSKDTDPDILKRIHKRFEYNNDVISINNYQPIGTSHLLIKKKILQDAGGIPDVFHGEDIVVMRKIMESGYNFVYLKEEKCYHYHVDSYYAHIIRQLRGIRNQFKTLLLR